MTDRNVLELLVVAAAGAFVYHTLTQLKFIEEHLTAGGASVSLTSLLDMAAKSDDDEDEPPVGFSKTPGKMKKK